MMQRTHRRLTQPLVALSLAMAAVTLMGAGEFNGRHDIAADDGAGAVSGTVLDSSDKPAVGVAVRLYADAKLDGSGSHDGGGGGRKGGRSVDVGSFEPRQLVSGEIAAQAKTDAKGQFSFSNIKAGTYTYRIGDPGTVGYTAGRIPVEAGKTATLNVKLKPPIKN